MYMSQLIVLIHFDFVLFTAMNGVNINSKSDQQQQQQHQHNPMIQSLHLNAMPPQNQFLQSRNSTAVSSEAIYNHKSYSLLGVGKLVLGKF